MGERKQVYTQGSTRCPAQSRGSWRCPSNPRDASVRLGAALAPKNLGVPASSATLLLERKRGTTDCRSPPLSQQPSKPQVRGQLHPSLRRDGSRATAASTGGEGQPTIYSPITHAPDQTATRLFSAIELISPLRAIVDYGSALTNSHAVSRAQARAASHAC